MKGKNLISLLQEIDPTGEIEVCINNVDIFDIQGEPAYYDGCLQILEWDEHERVIGVKVTSNGMKINLAPYSMYDAIDHDPDIPINLCSNADHHKEKIEQHRKDADALHKQFKYGKYYEQE